MDGDDDSKTCQHCQNCIIDARCGRQIQSHRTNLVCLLLGYGTKQSCCRCGRACREVWRSVKRRTKRDEHLRTATGLYTSAIRFERARHATRASCSSRNSSVGTCLGIAPCISTAPITFHFQSHYSTSLLLVARLTTHLGLVHTSMPPCSRQQPHINGRDGPLA